jgi:hypothetical protein
MIRKGLASHIEGFSQAKPAMLLRRLEKRMMEKGY